MYFRAIQLALCGLLAAAGAVSQSQEPDRSKSAPGASGKAPETLESRNSSAQLHQPINVENFEQALPEWSNEIQSGPIADLIPAVTNPCSSSDEAISKLDGELRAAISFYLLRWTAHQPRALQLAPSAEEIREKFVKSKQPIVVKETDGSRDTFRAALLIELPHHVRDEWLARYRVERQRVAVDQTIFVGGGILGFVGILALFTRLNHGTNGRRAGILRAAAAIAILTLFGGLTTAAVLGRIFSV